MCACIPCFYLIFDFIFNTGYRYFVGLFARKVLNRKGLTGQYIDMLTYSQASMCAGNSFLLLSDLYLFHMFLHLSVSHSVHRGVSVSVQEVSVLTALNSCFCWKQGLRTLAGD